MHKIFKKKNHVAEGRKKLKTNESNESVNLYPNCDGSIWTRSCEREIIEPIFGKVSGNIPKWLNGSLLRNGPGSLKVGEYRFDHLFDSAALLHRFAISDGKVTYQSRFVQTEVFKKNQTAKRIVVSAFGTKAVPDPCKSIFQRISTTFQPEMTTSDDNSMISIYPFCDEFYTFTESPIIHRVDPKTLETLGKVNVSKHVSIVNHTSHPHVMKDGTVYNVGLNITSRGPVYTIVSFSPSKIIKDEFGNERKTSMFDEAKIEATVASRWLLNPAYMHTFGITDNYFIIVEQPLSVALMSVMKNRLKNEPMRSSLKWHKDETTQIHVISRKTGKIAKSFLTETFFYLHIINQFETLDNDYVVLDICAYRDAAMLDCMYINAINNMQTNPDYANLFRGRPLRFILPMKNTGNNDSSSDENLIKTETVNQSFMKNLSSSEILLRWRRKNKKSLLNEKASAHKLINGKIFVKPELLCDLGLETPRINYDYFLGKEYRYFYGISSDVDLDNPGTIIKVDIVNKTRKTWCEKNVYPSEPIFVPSPDGKNEDDGIVLSVLIWGQERETEVGLLILNAATFEEIGRATFVTSGPVPKCLHGWFSSNV
ncbi:carotenoid isomerooxygenase isoform X3 [Leptopilina heterotoma]|uniref:carotenoid isomerooxygenase isoform X3 n=1 Tax=Leptopilina heterotoma TaxID=63436 RepID=UPI001CA9F505|nr:carotenoid isomerooxygenase isoform X3 [Leptopilina heterotoma]XP_043471151.1 carotenoid isomerooxygenase isoform X3 [Leptopilina heterotoma]XP_043471152.1 carotenoid isomerooxygenase isoform X3 [Leptopilina heterotoma]